MEAGSKSVTPPQPNISGRDEDPRIDGEDRGRDDLIDKTLFGGQKISS